MEREVGGGIRMGNTCKHMAVSFQCMTKFTTNKKKKKKKKENENFDLWEVTIQNLNKIFGYNIIITKPPVQIQKFLGFIFCVCVRNRVY